jgi:chromosome segregation ATPase
MKESDALKKEVAILQKRDDLLNLEITNLKSMIEIIEKEKTELREERNHLKNEKNTLNAEKLLLIEERKSLEKEIISLKKDLDFLRKTTHMEDIKDIQKEKKEEIQQKQTSFEFYS